jgi:hypothetical protein
MGRYIFPPGLFCHHGFLSREAKFHEKNGDRDLYWLLSFIIASRQDLTLRAKPPLCYKKFLKSVSLQDTLFYLYDIFSIISTGSSLQVPRLR